MARRFLTSDTAPAAATDGTPPAAPPHMQWRLHGSAVKVAIAGNVVVAVLFFVAVIWRIFFSGRIRGQDAAAGVATQAQQQGASSGGGAAARPASPSAVSTPRAGGLGKDDLLALPVYVHGSSPEDGGGGGGGEGTRVVECAVCISELRDGDTGRVLPRCGHRFHAECVDRWFRSHVTCPLCRAVVADGASGKPYPKAQLDV